MHSESNAMISNNMQQQQNQHKQNTQQYVTNLPQDHLTAEQNHQIYTEMATTSKETLNEGLYVPTPQQHLTSECPSQYYSNTSRFGYTPTYSSYSSSSSSSSSSDDSSYSCHNSSENQTFKNQNASIGVNLRVTGQCSQGGRKYMEDYFSVAYQQSENAKDLEYAFIGIYDGHGGAEAAKFAKEHLMMEIINQRLFWSDNDQDVLRAIREGYIATHYAMWREQDKWPKTANGLPSTAGTTATVAFIRREKLYIGHVGDSGIVLGYQNENENFWRAKQLTIDHKPESAGERTRIMNSGGKVVVKSGVPRVVWNRPRNASHCGPIRKRTLIDEIPFLAVARSLGDLWSYNSQRNEFVVSPDPDVSVIPINPSTFRCLIFGTDGLWNVISAQEAVNTVRSKEMINERLLGQRADSPHEVNQWTNPSKSLVEQALRTWSHKKMRADNTSVVTVILYPPGQVDHSTDGSNYEATNTLDSPPTFLQPISCGLEYTQVQAEIPPYDDGATYQEMALKYLPPEAYRNFNYYDDESDTDDNDESGDEHEAKPALSGDLQQNTDYSQPIASTSNWIWENNNDNSFATTVKDAADTNENNEENEDEDEEEEEDEEEQNVEGEERKQKGIVSIMNFQTYLNIEAEATNNATDSYINTFAESYNSILTASPDECIKATAGSPPSSSLSSNSNSNSNSNCQSVTPPNMHDILQEQHLYQQQCMSEEEGYSLTKLETRREQQTGKSHNRNAQLSTGTTSAIQTFKIFHESPLSPQQIGMYHTNTERFYHQHEQFIPEMVVKPLEFHSLLQQEREEEQQVAYERLQMEKKLHQEHENIAAYACLQTANGNITTAPLDEQSSVEEEYLEEESIMEEEEVLAVDNSCLKHDESVQIHEISSSSCDQPISEGKGNCSDMHLEDKEITEELEMLPNAISETITGADDPSEPVEIRAEVSVKAKKYSIITNSKNSIYLPATSPALSTIALTPFQPSFSRSKRNKSTAYLYNNVPNENLQRISNSKYNHSVYTPNGPSRNSKKNVCVTPSDMTPPTATSTPMIQRQLRSTTTPCANTISATHVIDYGKRTLRTRNSLSKDMKAKSSMVPGAFKTYPQNVVTRNFIRTTAANLLVGKPLLMNDLNVATCSRRSLATANIRPPLRSSIRTRREKANMTINGSLNQNKAHIPNDAHSQLNLRSRQTTPSSASSTSSSSLSSSNTSTVRSSAANAPVIKRASLTERRMHTRSTSSRGSQTPANFSKSTRTQSTGSNLAAPPPSPKLINAVAAVAAATRARSLLNAKHVAAANGTQSVVSSVFGKRTSLRRKVSTHAAVLPSNNTSASLSPLPSIHQTLRGRIVKKLKR